MQTPSPETLLHVWELGGEAGAQERGSLLLQAAHPGTTALAWREVPLGRRNEALLDLRQVLFGADLDGVAECPGCGELVEIEIVLPVAADRQPPGTRHLTTIPDAIVVTTAGRRLEVRLPSAAALEDLPPDDVEDAARVLLSRCVIARHRDGHAIAVDSLPPDAVTAVTDAMAMGDPYGLIQLSATCPACEVEVALILEPASFLWTELHRWASRTLREVGELASAFGWSEADILAMSPRRRRTYLDMVLA